MSTRSTVEDGHTIDVFSLHRGGWLRPGCSITTRWSRGERETGTIGQVVLGNAAGEPVALELRYRLVRTEEDITERVPLTWTPCYFGGRRPWFVCPAVDCGRRVAKLHSPPGTRYFLCQRCYRLTYESTRTALHNRPLMKAQRILRRLGASGSMAEPLPSKPKGMHRRTYMRLVRAYAAADDAYAVSFMGWLDRMDRRIDRLSQPQRVVRHRSRSRG